MTAGATPVAGSLDVALTPAWLTAALGERYPGTIVEAVEVRQLLHGVATKALLTLTYSGAHKDLPPDLCLKAGFEDHNRHLLDGGTYLNEARFYRNVAEELTVVVPRCFYAGCDEGTMQGVVVLEDLQRSGATMGSALRGHTVDEAAQFLDSFARLHASFGEREVTALHPWMDRHNPLESAFEPIYARRIELHLEDGRAATLPDAMRDPHRLVEAARRLVALLREQRICITHGDPHAGNLYITADGQPGLYDWQTVQASAWMIDVPYYLCAGLSHADRRRSAEDLLRHYLERLRAHGGTPPTWDEAQLAYRRFIIYGFFLWTITRPVVQPVDVIATFIDRLGTAAAEAESFAVLGVVE